MTDVLEEAAAALEALAEGRALDRRDLLIGAQKLDSLCKRGSTDCELLERIVRRAAQALRINFEINI
jgi:hypothetical protein